MSERVRILVHLQFTGNKKVVVPYPTVEEELLVDPLDEGIEVQEKKVWTAKTDIKRGRLPHP